MLFLIVGQCNCKILFVIIAKVVAIFQMSVQPPKMVKVTGQVPEGILPTRGEVALQIGGTVLLVVDNRGTRLSANNIILNIFAFSFVFNGCLFILLCYYYFLNIKFVKKTYLVSFCVCLFWFYLKCHCIIFSCIGMCYWRFLCLCVYNNNKYGGNHEVRTF